MSWSVCVPSCKECQSPLNLIRSWSFCVVIRNLVSVMLRFHVVFCFLFDATKFRNLYETLDPQHCSDLVVHYLVICL